MSRSFHDLQVWQKARELVQACYRLTALLPDSQRYGLISQIQRASVSVPANIAEGCGRGSKKEFIQFLRIAQGSLYEIETYLVLIVDLGFVSEIEVEEIEETRRSVGRLLAALIRSLEPNRAP